MSFLAERHSLVPYPKKLLPQPGQFLVEASTAVRLPDDPRARAVAERCFRHLSAKLGCVLGEPAASAPGTGAAWTIALDAAVPREGYRLCITPARVELVAAGAEGILYGFQTLEQLLERANGAARPHASKEPSRSPGPWMLPAVLIEDEPRFSYRGLHLDVGRHFFPLTFLKKLLDEMVALKLNVFHWHLTEDQGWRLEIKRYPKLTEVGAFRRETVVGHHRDVPRKYDGKPYGGFYTQGEARELVAYAAERCITVIPEIEMPGHSRAAIAAYPELGCTGAQLDVATSFGIWEDVLCPMDSTFEFLEGVLDEVLDIFPSRYIHIGGDEAPKAHWRASSAAQAVRRKEGLKDEDELQSYFIRRIEAFLTKRGRRLIGWDEILEGGLADTATVMSWRGVEGGVAAARMGRDVIMTPTTHCYLDYSEQENSGAELSIGGCLPLDKVYGFEPIPEELTPAEALHVLGAQANVWTEYMRSADRVEYMVFPRLVALAEVVWSPRELRDYASFVRRLEAHLSRLEERGVRYSRRFQDPVRRT